jgi:thymidylate synthase (FAD)
MNVKLLSFNMPKLSDKKDILRHSFYSFIVDGISRSCSHQLVRHRVASYSQQSQRYMDMESFHYVKPLSFKKCNLDYDGFMDSVRRFYVSSIKAGVPKEDSRFILPNACSTRIVFTMNGEEIVHFLRMRTCMRAQWEIRSLAIEVLRILRSRFHGLFDDVGPNCYYLGYCTEGEKSCGRMKEVVEFFRNLK